MQSKKPSKTRLPEIDFLRGIAIIMMAVFHFVWSLNYLTVITANTMVGFWKVFQTMTGSLFILLAGLSLTLSYSNMSKDSREIYPLKFFWRGLMIFGFGMIITLVSWLWMPKYFVFFGILHFMGTAVIIAAPFVRKIYFNLVLGIAALASTYWLAEIKLKFPWLVWVWYNHGVGTLDLYPLLPWIGLFFIGMFLGNMLYPKSRRRFMIALPKIFSRISSPIQFLGKHSLPMYFVHLPIVYIIAYLIRLL